MNNASYLAHTDPLLFSNGILKVHDIYKLNVGLYMYYHDSPSQFIRSHKYYTRRGNDLLPGYARLTLTQNAMSVDGPNFWTSILVDIANSPSRNSFKFKYKKFLLSLYNTNSRDPSLPNHS